MIEAGFLIAFGLFLIMLVDPSSDMKDKDDD